MSENHSHNSGKINPRKLLLATGLNLVISAAEVAGGLISGSLALLSDALHNVGDAFATFIAWIAVKISDRKSTHKRTFGLKRIEILAALINSVILVVLSIYLFIEAWDRWQDPVPIDSTIMLIVAVIGLLANVVAVYILHKDSKSSINVRAAYLHLIGDSLSSVVVIIGGLAIMFWEVYWIDPLITFLIGIYILKETYSILKEALNILMMNTPESLDLSEVKNDIEKIDGVENIHHIHAWSLTDTQTYFEAHVDTLKDLRLSEINSLREHIEGVLQNNYDIEHVTLQFEYKVKDDKKFINQSE